MPHINAAGLDIIRAAEGLRLRTYPDPGTGGEPWTIGYGHCVRVHPGQVITEAQALAFLAADVAHAELAVSDFVHVTLTPNQFSALVSWQYNTGAIRDSTLGRCVNQRDWNDAQQQFHRWIYAEGNVLPGLVTRRAAEAHLFGLA